MGTKRCGAYAENWKEIGKPKGWKGCSLPKGHKGNHSDNLEVEDEDTDISERLEYAISGLRGGQNGNTGRCCSREILHTTYTNRDAN